jgi:hypothetical protein
LTFVTVLFGDWLGVLLDLLKLSLTQLTYLPLLAIAVLLLGTVFPYSSKQSAMIGFVTMTLTFVRLSLWPQPGLLSRRSPLSQLAHVVLPAALLTTAAVLVVFAIFTRRHGLYEA